MPIAKWSKRLFNDRVEFESSLTKREVQALIADKHIKVLQCSSPVISQTWELLNDQFFTRRPEVELRIWGFHSQVCDLSFTSKMTNVHHFSADCLRDAIGVEYIASMEKLESLGVGIYHLGRFGFLNQVTRGLKRLFLGSTKSSKPDLSPLHRFASLEEIYIEGHNKNIEVLSQLENLNDVTLRSISTPDISYLRPLDRMWSLNIKLGGIKDLYAIEGMENIKYLELWQIWGLSDISVISTLTGLQFLFLQSLRRVTTLPPFIQLKKLRRIYLDNLKSLEDIGSLAYVPAIEEFIHVNAQNMQPEDYMPIMRNPNLKRASVHFSSKKKEKRFNELLLEHNFEPSPEFMDFEFV